VIDVKFSALRGTRPREYLIRFLFGGMATVLAGIIAKRFGPGVGGLFLAFPAIFPASVTLIESHEKERKAKIGQDGTIRGRMAASIDSAGAALGCVGLAGFALFLWRVLPGHNPWLVMLAAMIVWTALCIGLWRLRKLRLFGRHPRSHHPRAMQRGNRTHS
jgi:MFS family permease